MDRKIIHIDMDAFFASVEMLDHPELKGKPVIVGGDPQGRGVVAACSYEARRYGIHSAMACSRALRLCPRSIFLRPRKERYQEISKQIMNIFRQHTDLVEPLSLDEAFLDTTINKKNIPSATWIAREIREEILKETGLTCSAGVSFNKFLAKTASDFNKPDGITVITPDKAISFIAALPINKFYGVGKATEKKMLAIGIRNGADLASYSRSDLISHFGKAGSFFYDISRGVDRRTVQYSRERKSVGTEITLKQDTDEHERIISILGHLAGKIEEILSRKNTCGHTLTLKVRYQDFTTVTRSKSLPHPVFRTEEIMNYLPRLLGTTEAGRKKLRLLGITVSKLKDQEKSTGSIPRQLPLPFDRA